MDQVYTITTDNGTNMLKAIKILSEYEDSGNMEILEENQIEGNEKNNDNIHLETEESKKEDIEHADLNILEGIETIDINSNFRNNVLTGKIF